MIQIRRAREEDLPAITEIYNEAVRNTTATFDTLEKTHLDRLQWFQNRDENFPVYVVEKAGKVAGYGALNKWSDKAGYNLTAEISLYIHAEYRGLGIGSQLIDFIVAASAETNLHSIISRITEGNESSIHLHRKNGFEVCGILKEAGYKFGRYLDVTIMQKMLRS
jgi:phosphinothricin acetyltransferase